MIKVSNSIPVIALLLACAGAASAAAPASPQPFLRTGSCAAALSQLLAAAPGGADSLNALIIASPASSPAPRSELYDVAIYDTTQADRLIKGLAASARKTGKTNASLLFIRLLNEGTPAEKLKFMSATDRPYSFPSRFTLAVATGGICHAVTETFCAISCIHTGTANEQCREDCRTIIVRSCD